jgi:hypothetical protein
MVQTNNQLLKSVFTCDNTNQNQNYINSNNFNNNNNNYNLNNKSKTNSSGKLAFVWVGAKFRSQLLEMI